MLIRLGDLRRLIVAEAGVPGPIPRDQRMIPPEKLTKKAQLVIDYAETFKLEWDCGRTSDLLWTIVVRRPGSYEYVLFWWEKTDGIEIETAAESGKLKKVSEADVRRAVDYGVALHNQYPVAKPPPKPRRRRVAKTRPGIHWLDLPELEWDQLSDALDDAESEFAEYVPGAPYDDDSRWSTDDQTVYTIDEHPVYVAWSGGIEMPDVRVFDGQRWVEKRIKHYV